MCSFFGLVLETDFYDLDTGLNKIVSFPTIALDYATNAAQYRLRILPCQ